MNLSDFKTENKGANVRMVITVADTTGANDYELALAGPDAAIKEVFAKTDFAITIDPKRGTEDFKKELEEERRTQLNELTDLAALHNIENMPLFKKEPATPSQEHTVFVSIRRLRGEGTLWGPLTFGYILPTGWNIILLTPPLCSLRASVMPVSGDQDIFLHGGFFFTTLIARSILGGTATDRVSFSNPPLTPCDWWHWNLFLIDINGFRAGSGTFSMSGAS